MLLEGKVALIAGVGPGLGRDVALLFAEHGADVVFGSRRVDRRNQIVEEIQAMGRRAEAVRLDITDGDSCQSAVETACRAFGGLDILVNNAFDTGDFTKFEDADFSLWRKTMEVNLWGSLQMTRTAVPAMRERGGGRVVMVNTMSAWRHVPTFGAYTISKAALESATKMLAVELGQYGIRVNGIHPGYIWGEAVETYFLFLAKERGVTPEQVYGDVADETCLKYLPPSSEVAGSVLFLASDLATPITGQSLGVNCGHWLH